VLIESVTNRGNKKAKYLDNPFLFEQKDGTCIIRGGDTHSNDRVTVTLSKQELLNLRNLPPVNFLT
jgi:hypothetical protein